MLRNKLMTACSVALLTAALYGCSSSSDDGANMKVQDLQDQIAALNAELGEGEELTPEALAALIQAKADAEAQVAMLTGELGTANMRGDDAEADVTRLTGELGMANADVTRLEGELGMANADVTRLEGELGTANADVTRIEGELGTANADVTRLTGELGTANADVTRLSGELGMANARADGAEAEVTRLEGLLATANAELATLKRTSAAADATAQAEAKSEMAAEVLTALGETPSGTAPGIEVSASSSSKFTAEAAGYTMSGTPEGISGFRGAILTKDGAEARVYTSIENAAATPIGGIYQSTSLAGEPARYSVIAAPTPAGQQIPWSVVKRDDAVVTTTGTEADRVITFAGNVRGLVGTFSCSAASGCDAPARGTGGSVAEDFAVSGWTFAPTNPNGMIDVADKDGYLQFGWWLSMKGDDVDDGFDVITFADATAADGTSLPAIADMLDGEQVTGGATYRGGAAGKWAIASTTEDTTEGGHFTATATLGVDFDADENNNPEDGNDKFGVSVSGAITGFMTGDTSRPNWKVTLTFDGDTSTDGVQTSGTLTPMISGADATTKWTTGGAVDGMGTWEATFHGEEEETTHPTSVEGTFNAAIAGGTVGRIAGAFGATNQ